MSVIPNSIAIKPTTNHAQGNPLRVTSERGSLHSLKESPVSCETGFLKMINSIPTTISVIDTSTLTSIGTTAYQNT